MRFPQSERLSEAVTELSLNHHWEFVLGELAKYQQELIKHTLACDENRLATARGSALAATEILTAIRKARR